MTAGRRTLGYEAGADRAKTPRLPHRRFGIASVACAAVAPLTLILRQWTLGPGVGLLPARLADAALLCAFVSVPVGWLASILGLDHDRSPGLALIGLLAHIGLAIGGCALLGQLR
ncbi:MAG: hypothetical protein JWO31_2922 [Phycisphaerales bacterium]|nr:hypothetical protein [Phycisphaerales bacterium]